jgi:hypothetical protein
VRQIVRDDRQAVPPRLDDGLHVVKRVLAVVQQALSVRGSSVINQCWPLLT